MSERFTTDDSAAFCGDIKATSFRVYRVLRSLAATTSPRPAAADLPLEMRLYSVPSAAEVTR